MERGAFEGGGSSGWEAVSARQRPLGGPLGGPRADCHSRGGGGVCVAEPCGSPSERYLGFRWWQLDARCLELCLCGMCGPLSMHHPTSPQAPATSPNITPHHPAIPLALNDRLCTLSHILCTSLRLRSAGRGAVPLLFWGNQRPAVGTRFFMLGSWLATPGVSVAGPHTLWSSCWNGAECIPHAFGAP